MFSLLLKQEVRTSHIFYLAYLLSLSHSVKTWIGTGLVLLLLISILSHNSIKFGPILAFCLKSRVQNPSQSNHSV
jgi:hypothetical protein